MKKIKYNKMKQKYCIKIGYINSTGRKESQEQAQESYHFHNQESYKSTNLKAIIFMQETHVVPVLTASVSVSLYAPCLVNSESLFPWCFISPLALTLLLLPLLWNPLSSEGWDLMDLQFRLSFFHNIWLWVSESFPI